MSKEIALREGVLTATEVESVTFSVTRLRQGYDPKEVDDFLDRVQAEVALLTAENSKLRAALAEQRDGSLGDFGGATVAGGGVGTFGAGAGAGVGGGGGAVSGSADLLARRADIERDVNALEAFEREYRTRLRAWIGGMLDELDHPEDVPLNTPIADPNLAGPIARPLREKPISGALMDEYPRDIDDTSEIPVIDDRWNKKKKKKKKGKSAKRKERPRDFTLPPDDPHGPDSVTQPA